MHNIRIVTSESSILMAYNGQPFGLIIDNHDGTYNARTIGEARKKFRDLDAAEDWVFNELWGE